MGGDLAATRVLAATVLVNLGLAGIVGAWASVVWLHRSASPWASDARHRSWIVLRSASAVTAGVDVMLLWVQAAYMGHASLPDALTLLPSMLRSSYVGHAWLSGAAGLVLVFAAATERVTGRRAVRCAGVFIGISFFAYSRAAVSHAADAGLASPQLLVEGAHLWAIGLWLGAVGIAAFGILSRSHATTASDRRDLASWIRNLSATATGALLVIVGTGVFNASRGVGSVADLVGSAYGNTLLVKVALVAIAIALGGVNRFRTMPRLLSALQSTDEVGPSTQRFVQVLRIEAAFLFAALLAAAILSSSPLPPAT